VALTVQVPVRAGDVGGWTDTWFAGHGRVCSLALEPGVTVAVVRREQPGVGIDLPDLGARFDLAEPPVEHRLVAEALHEAGVPDGVAVTVTAGVPPGSSLGTSASVCVGLIAAVDALVRGAIRPPAELARAAHRVEVGRLGRQCGVQDQLAAALGGALAIDVRYPHSAVEPVPVPPETGAALDERLAHLAYGGAHDSSAVHERVVAELEVEGTGAPRLQRLRNLADEAAAALRAGDLARWGAALTAATDAQRDLHPDLVSGDADALVDVARELGALGWKVNGAGGAGGSLTVLCPDRDARERLEQAAVDLGARPLGLRLAPHGARLVDP